MILKNSRLFLNLKLLGWSFISFSAFSSSNLPSFEDFPIASQANITLQTIDFDSHPDGVFVLQKWQGMQDIVIGEPANFAGHYFVMGIGCGTACQLNIIVDVNSGKIVDSIDSTIGLCHQSDSELLIVNPRLSDYGDIIPEWAYTYYYQLENGVMTLLEKSKVGFDGACEFGQ
ncbi:hypothetical protein [Aliiglaciecola lipolytica]|uniref:Uncharacterized protein n=1 Tax=Aliiglaciecola lipolytica E3 TaxID=1127673 RepID=K6Y3P6_9ALTE|nr:hypothetical protein [Aliiglaciecola lipolytica]GAC12882.1 hypothetical protein GLIP_0228 [Aliiglaciecola lipolytica E3]